MASWMATKAKARFSELLTAAETEGPQLIRRRNQTYVVTTQEEMEKRMQEGREGKRANFISAWEALTPSFAERFDDVEFPRLKTKARSIELG